MIKFLVRTSFILVASLALYEIGYGNLTAEGYLFYVVLLLCCILVTLINIEINTDG